MVGAPATGPGGSHGEGGTVLTDTAARSGLAARPGAAGSRLKAGWATAAAFRGLPDTRRCLQLGLSIVWLLDAVLQGQSVMFTGAFARMVAATAAGNPAVIAGPIIWASHLIGHHPVLANAGFAAIELLLALGMAWRPTVKGALAVSIVWSVGVWWLGEGLGGLLAGTADPVTGAPGAVIIYILLALLLWPADHGGPSSGAVALRPLGAASGRLIWLVLWVGMACLALAGRASQGLGRVISQQASGEPGWLATFDRDIAGLPILRGQTALVILAAVLAVIGAGIYLPPPAVRVVLSLAAVMSAAIWVAGENFGGVLSGSATDPGSGLVLVLLAAAYWPGRFGLPRPAHQDPGTGC
jgi:hypothetical protein